MEKKDFLKRKKAIIKIILLSWLIVFSVIGICILKDTPKQIKKDNDFVNLKIKPTVDFIVRFSRDSLRLPTNRDFYAWERDYYKDFTVDLSRNEDSLISGSIAYIRNRNDLPDKYMNKYKDVDWKKNFMIAVWRGEGNEYYLSWEKRYDTNGYSWKDGFEGLIICIGIGFLPILLFRFKVR